MSDHPPDEIDAPPVTLRRFRPEAIGAMTEAINQSLDHLRPWMAWAQSPVTEADEAKVFADSERHFEEGSEFAYIIFDGDGQVLGSCGLHRRGPANTVEIGYWVHVDHVKRGVATAAARALTDAGFELDGVDQVEIHCDARNVASASVPEKLGYQLVGVFDEPERQEMVWAIRRDNAVVHRR
jgi:RimJ/RimL family protein N-acetyltransferase